MVARLPEQGHKGIESAGSGKGQPQAVSTGESLRPAFGQWLDDQLANPAIGGLTPRGLPPEVPETGEVGAWNIPVPEINPLGAQKLYTLGTGYSKANGIKLALQSNQAEIQKSLSGEVWTLSFSAKKGDVLPFLKEYVQKIGGEVLPSRSEDGLVCRLLKPDAIWWCDVSVKAGGRVDMRVLRQMVLTMNEDLKITKSMFASDGSFHFLADVPGKKLTLLQCRLTNGAFRLRANNDFDTREGKTLIRYMKYLNAAEYGDYTLYDFPQDPGLYEFYIDKYGSTMPDEIIIRLTETAHDLPGYRGSGLGELLVKNVPAGKVSVTPQNFVEIRQGVNLKAAGVAAGNDVSFHVPAGYYTLVNELGNEFREAKTQLVPVSEGERTVVRLPDSWKSANQALLARGDDREVTGEITVNGKKDLGATAEIALSVSDPRERDVFPTKENTVITESGARTGIIDIRREVAPCSVALVIDSSGSMKKDMKATLAAARTFLQSLPENSFVQIVDFDSAVRELKGSTVKEAIKNLGSIKAEGSTKLYDAALKGLDLVKGKTRPAVVLFTDGIDSREDKQGAGSISTRVQAVKKISEAKVPVFTIGFGKRLNADETIDKVDGAPDIGCLTEFADVSNGQYYPAKDPEALEAVFSAIGSRLGNNFVITYKRPTENNTGSTPVLSLVIDNSGSMNSDPKKSKDGDFRMEKTKKILRDFVEKLPDPSVMQFTTFQGGGAMRVDVMRRQVSTTSKAQVLKALGEMAPVDGTPIVAALTSAYENLVTIPSQKKVIIFHTDSGLEVSPAEKPELQKILDRIKEKGIFVLWIGMGITNPAKEKVFAEVAKATDGEYVISEGADDIARKLATLLERLQKPVENRMIPLTIDMAYHTPQGETLRYKVQDQAPFSPPAKVGTPLEPEVVAIETGTKAPVNDAGTAKAVVGAAIENIDTVISGKAELALTMHNKAMELTLRRVVSLDRLQGLDARKNGYQLVACELEMKNQTEKHIPYLIPSIFKHFYLGLDGKSLYPASKATWLVEHPVTRHGDPSIQIPPGGTVSGTLVFLVPARTNGIARQSLHFYDTDFGHIQMPIGGTLAPKWFDLEKLPSARPADLAEAFSLNVTAAGLENRIDSYTAGDYAAFRVIEAEFSSQVQALLNIDPAQRIYLRYPTTAGDLMCRLSEVTAFTPLGFREPVMLGPGAANVIRLIYDVPSALEEAASELFFDLAKGSAVFPVTGGKPFASLAPGSAAGPATSDTDGSVKAGAEGNPKATAKVNSKANSNANTKMHTQAASKGGSAASKKGNPQAGSIADAGAASTSINTRSDSPSAPAGSAGTVEIEGDGVKVRINQLVQLQKPITLTDNNGQERNLYKGCVLLDVTFIDQPGNDGTLIPQNFFALVSSSYKPKAGGPAPAAAGRIGMGGGAVPSGKELLHPSSDNNGLIFGIGPRFGVFEGQQRRAIVIFGEPASDVGNWTLQSPYNDKIHVAVGKGDFVSSQLLAWHSKVPTREPSFARLLDGAVTAAVQKYTALNNGKGGNSVIKLEKDDGYNEVVLPSINTFGIQAMSAVTNEKQFLDLMKTIVCLPKNAHNRIHNFDYSPESVVTQGFGDIGATANLAQVLLSKLGFSPRLNQLEFTDAGARLLLDYYGIDVKRDKTMPLAVSYENEAKERRMLVLPFMRELKDLTGLVYQARDNDTLAGIPASRVAVVTVVAVYEPGSDGSVGASAMDAGSALGGGGGQKLAEIRMLQKPLPFDALSRDAIDLAFAPVPTRGKTAYGAILSTPEETVVGEKALENFKSLKAVRVEISGLDHNYAHTIELTPGQKPERFLITLGINLPDLPRKSTRALNESFKAAFAAAKNPEPFTAVRWHHRQILYKLIAGQTAYDTDLVPAGKLVLGRIHRPRCLVIASERGDDGKLTTWIDLLQPFNEIHAGSEELKKGYFLANGFFQSSLESRILPAETRMGYLDLWRGAPKDTDILAMPVMANRQSLHKEFEKAGAYPPRLLKSVKENKKVLIFPSKPTMIAGRERFAWLEIDPSTYEVLSVFDNGYHGGSAEFSMLTTSLGEDTREFVKGTWLGVNMSVWSVGSIALKTSDKGQIFTEAKALALKIGGILAEFQDNLKKAKEYYDQAQELLDKGADIMEQIDSGGGVGGGDEDDSDDTDYGGKIKENLTKVFEQLPRVKICGVDVNAKIKEGFRGFTNGYETAVDVYFHFFSGTKKHVEVERGNGEGSNTSTQKKN